MSECVGLKYILNTRELPVSEFNDDILQSGKVVYEVIRVEEGVPLYVEDYLDRLEKTIHLSGINVDFSRNHILESILRLIRINDHKSGPVKLMLSSDDFLLHYMKPYLPDTDGYISGVKTIFMHEERINPNAKVWNAVFREKIIAALKQSGAYEAILVSKNQEITEGSRSNVFFVKGDKLFTAPASTVLPGITRMKVLKACSLVGIKVNEVPLPFGEIRNFESAFLTGTSRKVLPISQIDDLIFQSGNVLVKTISAKFEELTAGYISFWKSKTNNELEF